MERVHLQRIFAVGEGVSNAAVGMVDEREVALAGKSMACHGVCLAVQMIGVLPQSADNREEGG